MRAFTLSAPKALPAGTIALITLNAKVPDTAAYGSKQVLDIVEVFLNDFAAEPGHVADKPGDV